MTRLTLFGRVTDALGHAEHRSYGWEGNTAVETRRFEALASIEYRHHQPGPIPVRLDHGGRDVGRCVHLERTPADDIIAVAEVDGIDDLLSPRTGPHYWSPSLLYRAADHSDVQITELAIVDNPATYGLGNPLDLLPGNARQAADWVKCRHRPQLAAILTRAAEADRRRPYGGPITIAGRRPISRHEAEERHYAQWVDEYDRPLPMVHPDDDYDRPRSKVEIRPGGRVLSVH